MVSCGAMSCQPRDVQCPHHWHGYPQHNSCSLPGILCSSPSQQESHPTRPILGRLAHVSASPAQDTADTYPSTALSSSCKRHRHAASAERPETLTKSERLLDPLLSSCSELLLWTHRSILSLSKQVQDVGQSSSIRLVFADMPVRFVVRRRGSEMLELKASSGLGAELPCSVLWITANFWALRHAVQAPIFVQCAHISLTSTDTCSYNPEKLPKIREIGIDHG
jgi:hypothetical protein